MVWSQDDIDAFKARLHERENGIIGKVEEYVNSDQSPSNITSPSSSRSPSGRKWNAAPTEDTRGRSDEWLGTGSPTGKKRSWKVKSIKPAVVPKVPDIMDC